MNSLTPKHTSIEHQMEKMSKLHDDSLLSIDPLPEPNEFGQITLPYQQLRNLIRQRCNLSYANGFFYGIACTS